MTPAADETTEPKPEPVTPEPVTPEPVTPEPDPIPPPAPDLPPAARLTHADGCLTATTVARKPGPTAGQLRE